MRADLNAVQGMVPVLVDHTFRSQKQSVQWYSRFGVCFLQGMQDTTVEPHSPCPLVSKFHEILVDVWYPLQ
jgi:hypothetical protein